MYRRLGQLQKKWRAEGREALDAGIGMNSGEMIVGNMGAEGLKMDYTVIGDNVNLAARVESLTRQYNTRVSMITESTYQGAQELVNVRVMGYPHEKRNRSTGIKHKERRRRRMKIGHVLFKDLDAVKVKGRPSLSVFLRVLDIEESTNEAKSAGMLRRETFRTARHLRVSDNRFGFSGWGNHLFFPAPLLSSGASAI